MMSQQVSNWWVGCCQRDSLAAPFLLREVHLSLPEDVRMHNQINASTYVKHVQYSKQ